MKKTIYLLMMITCLISIFLFSSKTSKESNTTSKKLIENGIVIYETITNKKLNHKEIIHKLNYPIRKLAHFTIFFILGISIILFLYTTKLPKKSIIAISSCIIFAILDETHQIFTIGRTPQVLDVLIDSTGSIIGIIGMNQLKGRSKENENKTK